MDCMIFDFLGEQGMEDAQRFFESLDKRKVLLLLIKEIYMQKPTLRVGR